MKSLILVFAVMCMVSSVALARTQDFADCTDQFPGGIVPNAASSTIMDLCKVADGKAIFAVRFDTTRKTPNWAVHKLSRQDFDKLSSRKRPRFFPDSNVPANDQATDKSYTHSGYSRGHLVPAYDMSWHADAYHATFNLTNVVPQKQRFNAGTWLGMEAKLRNLVKDKNVTIWDFSGVYGQIQAEPTIGTEPHSPVVPKCYYKVIVTQTKADGPYKVLAALFHWNDFGKQKTWIKSITSLDHVQQRSGINFLQGLVIESPYDADFWEVAMPNSLADCA